MSGRASGIRLEIFPRHEKYYWLGTYEPEVLDEIAGRLLPGATSRDVGSHVGYMVAVASRLVGPTGSVIAYEPNPANVRRLLRTLELNDLRNVTIREVALTDHVGQSEFFTSDSSSMGTLMAGSHASASLSVRTSTADAELMVVPAPDLIKIDVEGSESLVLAGASHLLTDCHPELIVEVLSQEQQQDVAGRLVGYRTSMLDGRNMLALPPPRTLATVR